MPNSKDVVAIALGTVKMYVPLNGYKKTKASYLIGKFREMLRKSNADCGPIDFVWRTDKNKCAVETFMPDMVVLSDDIRGSTLQVVLADAQPSDETGAPKNPRVADAKHDTPPTRNSRSIAANAKPDIDRLTNLLTNSMKTMQEKIDSLEKKLGCQVDLSSKPGAVTATKKSNKKRNSGNVPSAALKSSVGLSPERRKARTPKPLQRLTARHQRPKSLKLTPRLPTLPV